jgi:hypothetical protein
MVRSTKQTCVQNQTANPLTPKLGVPANKIAAYCDCFAENMASAIKQAPLTDDNSQAAWHSTRRQLFKVEGCARCVLD